jgi:hypothetical protein
MQSLAFIAVFEATLWRPTASPEFGVLIFIGSLLLVALMIFLWVIFRRMPVWRPHPHSRRRVSHHAPITPLSERRKRSPLLFRMLHFKRRRRHQRHRFTNPTLAETGGLPPQRNEHPPAT